MAPLPHFDGKLQFICEICNLTKVFNEIEYTSNQYNIICKSCYKQIQRENKIKNLLNEDETET